MTLQEWQTETGISNTELAKRVGIHGSYITHIKKGLRTVSPKVAERIELATNGQVSRFEMLYPIKSKP